MKKLTHDEISENRSTLENIHEVDKLPVYVILNSIRSSYNVGSMFRTSDGAMIQKLHLCGYTPHPPNKDILKTLNKDTYDKTKKETTPEASEETSAEVVEEVKKEAPTQKDPKDGDTAESPEDPKE